MKELLTMKKSVGISYKKDSEYAIKGNQFRPAVKYCEYPFDNDISPINNDAYDMVRQALYLYGLDEENFNTVSWNPFKSVIKPGNKVVIKPNLVMDFNPSGDGVDCLYTQPSVVAPIIDYAIIALMGHGEIVVGDAPMQECDFSKLVEESGYDELITYYKEKLKGTDIKIKLKDFRGYVSKVKDGVHYGEANDNSNSGVLIDLGQMSEFADYDTDKLDRLRINSYNPEILRQHHNNDKHEYLVNEDIISADVIINVPKPKTHRKAGVTIALKNLVGINVRKEYLPHHCNGDSSIGGDEYNQKNAIKRIKSRIQDLINFHEDKKNYTLVKVLIFMRKICTFFIRQGNDQSWDGSWYGNETISKTISDLNKILLYSDKNGTIKKEKQRNIFIVADMIVSGENEGPVEPTRKAVGLIAVGEDPVCFDEVMSKIMGMDPKKIPTLRQARSTRANFSLTEKDSEAIVYSNNPNWDKKCTSELCYDDVFHFIPAIGWIGHIELDK